MSTELLRELHSPERALLRVPRGKRGHAVHYPGNPLDVGWSIGGVVWWHDGHCDEVDLFGRLYGIHDYKRVVRIKKPTYQQKILTRRARKALHTWAP